VDACQVAGLEPGLYHDHIGDFALELLKKNRTDSVGLESSPWAVIYATGVFVRSSWKYRGRAYRYILNDTGHVIANIVLAARSLGFSLRLDYDFEDGAVNSFLGLDQTREVCFARICLFNKGVSLSETEVSPVLWGMSLAMPVADYGRGGDGTVPSVISMIHGAGFQTGAGNRRCDHKFKDTLCRSLKDWHPIQARNKPPVARPFGESLVQRRSRRNFQIRPLEQDLFFPFVDLVMKGFDLMEKTSRVYGSLKLGLLVRDAEGFDDGHYVSDIDKHSIGCLDAGHKTGVMASACLDQRWLANASVHFVMTGDVECVEREIGARAYRYMMMNAGFLGQIIYLAATSLGLGCCGIGAFYDHEASMVLDGESESLLYLVAAGHVKGSG
jgi:SagB-type dehydrogenase family enzyme